MITTAPEPAPLTAKDFATDQEVRWCPGCGDYSILGTGTESNAADWCSQRKYCDYFGYWLQQPFSILYEYIWHALHSWKSNCHCKWIKSNAGLN